MNDTLSVQGHDLTYRRDEYEDFDERGNPFVRLAGRGHYRCSCGAHNGGLHTEMTEEIRTHLGIGKDGNPLPA